MSSDALIYHIGVPYVEESKVTTGDYINNTNVDTLNDVLIHMAEKNDVITWISMKFFPMEIMR